MKRMRYIALFLAFTVLSGYSQERLPREYVPPQELCSINGQLEFQDAISILSEYSVRFANKPIFDPTKQQGPIGIDIDAMQWEKALQVMLSTRGLWYNEKDHFLEIGVPAQESTSGGGSNSSSGINIRMGSREVKIETIFFEGNRKAISEIGIDWSTFYNGTIDVSGDQLGALSVNESFLDVSVILPSETYDVDVRALLSVFDSKNIGKVLAQPQVVVTEGNQGKVQVGQDFSIKTRDFAGNIIDRFFSTGTILEVTPYIIKDRDKGQAIVLKAHVERSNATPDVVSTIINKSEANSYIQLFDGEETIIAGLYNTESSTLRKGIPILKDLPPWFFGLSYLFGYNREEMSQKELIIIIKATILPDVFERKDMPVDQNYWDEDAEMKVDPYRRNFQEPQRPTPPVRSVYNQQPASRQTSQSFANNQIVSQPRSAPAMEETSMYTGSQQYSKPVKSSERQYSQSYQETAELPTFQPDNVSTKPNAQPKTHLVARQQKTAPPKKTVIRETTIPPNNKNYFLGHVEKVDEDIVLIKWQEDFNTNRLHGNRFSVIRMNGDRKPSNIGMVIIQSTKYERSIARKVDGQVRPGDMIVVKFDNNV